MADVEPPGVFAAAAAASRFVGAPWIGRMAVRLTIMVVEPIAAIPAHRDLSGAASRAHARIGKQSGRRILVLAGAIARAGGVPAGGRLAGRRLRRVALQFRHAGLRVRNVARDSVALRDLPHSIVDAPLNLDLQGRQTRVRAIVAIAPRQMPYAFPEFIGASAPSIGAPVVILIGEKPGNGGVCGAETRDLLIRGEGCVLHIERREPRLVVFAARLAVGVRHLGTG